VGWEVFLNLSFIDVIFVFINGPMTKLSYDKIWSLLGVFHFSNFWKAIHRAYGIVWNKIHIIVLWCCLRMKSSMSSYYTMHFSCTWRDIYIYIYIFARDWTIFFNHLYFRRFYLANFKLKWRYVNGYKGIRCKV